jgi:Phosphate-selective porin O and P
LTGHITCCSSGVNSRKLIAFWPCFVAAASLFVSTAPAHASDTNLEQEVQLLREQNTMLQQQLQKQGQSLDTLTQKVQSLEAENTEHENAASENSAQMKNGFNLGKVVLSGEGGVGFQKTGSEGFSPNASFTVQEARLFLDAPIWKDVYFYSEVDLATPENNNAQVNLGELYVDFESVSQLWDRDGQLNVRVGKMNVPFGEEYQTRHAIDNPLILNSVSDFWGYDPGVEIYGALGKFSYCVAVQNGGGNGVQDDNDDKSVSGRIGFDPNKHWHFSLSGMRTGNINAQNGGLSAEWFSGGFFQSIGSMATTEFHVNAVELDTTARWASGYAKAFGGYAQYGDNNPAANNSRDIFYYSGEVVQNLPKKFYAVARFSEVIANDGYPILGNGNPSDYFSELATDLWRLSLGIGYRFSDRLIIKTEYSLEGGQQVNGESRNNENFFGSEVAFKF